MSSRHPDRPQRRPRGGKADLQLLEQVLRREEAAWQALLGRYRPIIFGCIYKALGRAGCMLHNEAADDIFGEVCVNLLRDDMKKLRVYDPRRGSKLGSWLGLIAINTTYDHLRARSRTPVCDDLDGHADPADAAPQPLELLLLCEQKRHLEQLMKQLPWPDRRFLRLYVQLELPPQEIARLMRISTKTVYAKRAKLERRLIALAQAKQAA